LIFFAGISVASNDASILNATSRTGMSPFSVALKNAGWAHGPDLINAFMLTSSFSAINSSVYVSTRSLYSLADMGRAPAFLKKTVFGGVPIYAALVSNAVGLLALINVASGAGKVFGYIIDIAGSACFIAYAWIGIIHIRFRKAWRLQGHTVEELPFRAMWYPYGAYGLVVFNTFLLFINGYGSVINPFHPVDFVFSYIIVVLFALLWVFWKFYHKTHVVNLAEVDLQYGQRSYLGDEDEEEEPSRIKKAFRSFKNRSSS
jgi:amino acid transporter